jgi:deoxyribonuclease-4
MRLELEGIRPLAVHVPYFVNLAAEDDEKWQYSRQVLVEDLERAAVLGAQYVVTHAGHARERREAGLERAALAVGLALSAARVAVQLLIETTSGQAGELGSTFAELERLRVLCGGGERLGFCLDTAHVFAAGYDVSTHDGVNACLDSFDRACGLQRLRLLHLNDSAFDLGSRRDRHAPVGQGRIGVDGFACLLSHPDLAGRGGVLETPTRNDDYGPELALLKRLRSGS